MIEDVSQVMTKHITNILSGVIGEYTIYKETHDTIMGLPCVRRLHERIMELEQNGSGDAVAPASASAGIKSREDEIAQLQSAIVDLNRYIHALESKVDMKSVASTTGGCRANDQEQEEESVKLEIHENDGGDDDGDDGDNVDDGDNGDDGDGSFTNNNKNVIISHDGFVANEEEADEAEVEEEEAEEEEEVDAEEEEVDAEEPQEEAEEAEEADAEEAEEEEAEEEEAEEEEPQEEAEAEEEAKEEDAEEEEADEEPEEEEAEEEEAEEEEPEEEEEAAPAEEEAEIEVSEVKIKGKTYFTTDAVNGIIYACVDDDVGDEVGVFKNGVAMFNKGKK
jgi:hypothetical protein